MEDFFLDDEEAKEQRSISNPHQPGIGAVGRRNPKPRANQFYRTSHAGAMNEISNNQDEFFDCIEDALSGRMKSNDQHEQEEIMSFRKNSENIIESPGDQADHHSMNDDDEEISK